MFRDLIDPLRLRLPSRLAGGEARVSALAVLEGGKLEDDLSLRMISVRLKALHGVR